jgi:hypothetical protein
MDKPYKQDSDLIKAGVKPNYVVWSEHLGCPFVDAKLAIKWHNDMLAKHIRTIIIDLTNYDWDKNPLEFNFLDTKDLVNSAMVN